jgi:hypothetical protein
MPRLSRPCYAVANPSEVAKAAGTPNNLIVTCPAAGGRALRARRWAHERRECARCARERITSAMGGEATGGDRLISRRWYRTSWIQARRCSLRLQSREAATGQNPPAADGAAHSPGAALRWRCPATGTARAAGRADSCECWLHTPRAGSRRLLGVAHAGATSGQQDTAASHRAGEQSPGLRSG